MSFTADFLDSLGVFSIHPGLDATFRLLEIAGHPEKSLRFIHIAGTNGKGSTGAMLESALRNAGWHTGFYTSPHLIDVRERFRIDGKMVDAETLDALARELAAQAPEKFYSYFEFATVLAAKLFAQAKCDVVIWETGLGGRLDATNTVTPVASVITNIALDHVKLLGSTLGEIAAEKAGIIKAGVPVFTGALVPEAAEVVSRRAQKLAAPLTTVSATEIPLDHLDRIHRQQCFKVDDQEIRLALLGGMQRRNCALAFNVIRYLCGRYNLNLTRAIAAWEQVKWPGRMQWVRDQLIVDGGHNPDGVGAAAAAMRELFPQERPAVIYGAFRDKAVEECLRIWAKTAGKMIFVPLPVAERPSHTPDELLNMWSKIAPDIPAETAGSGVAAIPAEPHELTIVSGSLYLAGDILRTLSGENAAGDLV